MVKTAEIDHVARTIAVRHRAAIWLAALVWMLPASVLVAQQPLRFDTVNTSIAPPAASAQDAQPIEAGATPEASATPETQAIPTRNLLNVVREGGLLMLPIAMCSIILLVFIFERSISLRRGRVIPRPFVKRLLGQVRDGQLDRDTALHLCEKNKSPVAEVFAAALRKWGRPAVEVEQAILDSGERVTNGLRKYLRVLNGIATISPLLGLLGTVLGMIRAFNAIATADAMGHPEMLAGGISQALLTTAAGLSVAIPALIAYLFFAGRVDQLIVDIDALGQRLVGSIAADSIGQRNQRTDRGRDSDSRSKDKRKVA